ncbi:hypothetical protein C8R43DRAFT_950217 [Mycena crocata]|nr:hypothetical protein C8R43DRAFT_950217 [Mycena crocata]
MFSEEQHLESNKSLGTTCSRYPYSRLRNVQHICGSGEDLEEKTRGKKQKDSFRIEAPRIERGPQVHKRMAPPPKNDINGFIWLHGAIELPFLCTAGKPSNGSNGCCATSLFTAQQYFTLRTLKVLPEGTHAGEERKKWRKRENICNKPLRAAPRIERGPQGDILLTVKKTPPPTMVLRTQISGVFFIPEGCLHVPWAAWEKRTKYQHGK